MQMTGEWLIRQRGAVRRPARSIGSGSLCHSRARRMPCRVKSWSWDDDDDWESAERRPAQLAASGGPRAGAGVSRRDRSPTATKRDGWDDTW